MGIGLSRLFSASGLEDQIVGEDTDLANSMGLFLQKTNIIRDYLEDNIEGREFWPKEVCLSTCKIQVKLTLKSNYSNHNFNNDINPSQKVWKLFSLTNFAFILEMLA